MLRCTLAGLIPLMMSEKYSAFTEEFYQEQKGDFNKIIKNKSFYLIRDLPVEVASRILLPEIPGVLSKQKTNGLWYNSTRVTYDILSAFSRIGILDSLAANKKLKNVADKLADKYDYESLLIKSIIYRQTNKNDVNEINKLIEDSRCMQNDNGSWEETVVATVFQIEKLASLGVSFSDPCIQRGVAFLFKNLNLNWDGLQGSGKPYGLQSHLVFSAENRDREFESAEKYKGEMVPRLICYRHLGIMQNFLCLKLFLQMGLEHDDRVECALDNLFSLYKKYNSLCYFTIQKKFVAAKRAKLHKEIHSFRNDLNV